MGGASSARILLSTWISNQKAYRTMKNLFPKAFRNVASAALLALIAAGSGGCSHYGMGFIPHPQISTVAIGRFENQTDEPALAVILRKQLAEQFSTDTALRLAESDQADVLVRGKIIAYELNRESAAKLRDDDEQPENRSTYATSIFNVKVTVEFETVIPSRNNARVIPRKRVVGDGDFNQMPDLNVSRQMGLQQALHDAATQIVYSITEAW